MITFVQVKAFLDITNKTKLDVELLVQERMIKHSQSHKHEHPFLNAQNLISDVAFLHFTRIAKTNCMSYHKSFKKRYFNFLTKYSF